MLVLEGVVCVVLFIVVNVDSLVIWFVLIIVIFVVVYLVLMEVVVDD